MTVMDETGVGFAELIRDTRHLGARAASDLADWLAYLSVEGKADKTLYVYMRRVAELLNMYPEHEIGDFTAADITTWLALKPARSRHIPRSIIAQWFGWAEHMELIAASPMNKVPKMRQPHRRPKDIYSPTEIALLENLALPDGQLWTLLFTTAMRVGEARNLRREHIDLNRARLMVVDGKGSKDRIIPLAATALAAVADLDLYEGLKPHDHLWYTMRGTRRLRREPIADTTFRDRWYTRTLKAAGVRYLNPHQTRHTVGHRLRELGFDIEERQLFMGHESIATTQKYYGRVTIEDVAAKVAETVGL